MPKKAPISARNVPLTLMSSPHGLLLLVVFPMALVAVRLVLAVLRML